MVVGSRAVSQAFEKKHPDLTCCADRRGTQYLVLRPAHPARPIPGIHCLPPRLEHLDAVFAVVLAAPRAVEDLGPDVAVEGACTYSLFLDLAASRQNAPAEVPG